MTNLNTTTPVATTGLRFDDEFNTFSSSVDGKTGTWMTTYPFGGENANTLTPNGEGEYYGSATGPNSPFSLSNGVLNITASKAAAGSNPYGLPYTSGLITTDGSFSQTYGYFEISAKLPAGQGLWPAFWMLPTAAHDSTELDVFEVLGSSPSTLYGSTHGSSGVSQAFTVPDTSTGFHTYGVDWEPSTVTFYMDGTKIGSTPTPASMNQPMYMLLNLAVGGATSWPGAPNATTAFPSTMQIDYVRAYATSATIYSGGSAALPPVAAPVVLGSGPDVLALQVAEDAWQGDAQYTVSVDGTQVGGVQTATASHAAGATQTVDVMGSFAPGQHTATVNFLNDAWGGSNATDRNLYVTQASVDNTAIPSSSLAEFSGGPQSFSFQGPPAADTLTLGVSEDAWQGDAQYTVSVDGKQVGGIYTATASHAAGQTNQQTISGLFGRGAHTVGVTFINDAWGGSNATDRNLYVNAVNYDGTQVAVTPIALFSNGTASIATPAVPNTLTLHLAEDAYQGDAQFTVAIDGKQMGAAQSVTASNAKGATQAFNFAVLGSGTHDVAVSFLNDAYGGSSALDRNLHVAGADLNGSALSAAPWTAALLTTSTTHFSLVVP